MSPSAHRILDRRTVAEIQKNIIKQGGRHRVARFLYARNDKDTIAGWKLNLNRILVVFDVRPVSLYLVATNSPLVRLSLL